MCWVLHARVCERGLLGQKLWLDPQNWPGQIDNHEPEASDSGFALGMAGDGFWRSLSAAASKASVMHGLAGRCWPHLGRSSRRHVSEVSNEGKVTKAPAGRSPSRAMQSA